MMRFWLFAPYSLLAFRLVKVIAWRCHLISCLAFKFLSCSSCDFPSASCSVLVFRKPICVSFPGDSCGRCLAEPGEYQFHVIHMVSELLFLQALELFVLAWCHPECGF